MFMNLKTAHPGLRLLGFFALIIVALAAPVAQRAEAQEARVAAAEQAYLYTYPLVLMDVTRRQMTNTAAGEMPGRGPMNQFTHLRAFPEAEAKEVVRPNFDTLYSLAWIDVGQEPVVLSVPEVKDRFYLLPMLDMWTDVFAVPGTYATGTDANSFVIASPDWQGDMPDGMTRIDAPTPMFWILGRTQTNGVKDYEKIHAIQDAYKIVPLSAWGKDDYTPPAFVKDTSVDDTTPPLEQVANMSAKDYFTYAMELMQTQPPHITDMVMVSRMKRIGLVPDGFDYDALPSDIQAALEQGAKAAQAAMLAEPEKMGTPVNGWQMTTSGMGVYGNDYLRRATIAMIGLGANPVEQAIYPLNLTDAEGNVPQGDKTYVLHFEKDEIPPAHAFWSLTMYDEAGFQVANPINRFAIGDRDDMKYNDDGSLDILIQHGSPGAGKESNWLPSPASGTLGMTLRLYWPDVSALDGSWVPPVLKEVK